MADVNYQELKELYKDFSHPFAVLTVAGQDLQSSKQQFGISEVDLELSSGFEASIATIRINKVFDVVRGKFLVNDLKKYIQLGNSVKLSLGYSLTVTEIFRGFIAKVNFVYESEDMPAVILTCMDVKGMMMANSYSKQLTANCWSKAVNEIFQQSFYTSVTDGENGIIKKLTIYDTPDAPPGGGEGGGQTEATDKTIEMVGESDYEFVVKAAKKFNYDFFVLGGEVVFRAAKSDPSIYMEIGPDDGLLELDVGYDITGFVEKIEVRNVDPGKGKLIKSKSSISNTVTPIVSKTLYKGMSHIYIDPTASSDDDAGYRAKYLVENSSYHFGSMKAQMIGMPDLVPGKFYKIADMGDGVSNKYYVTNVRHHMMTTGDFKTTLTGIAATIESSGGM